MIYYILDDNDSLSIIIQMSLTQCLLMNSRGESESHHVPRVNETWPKSIIESSDLSAHKRTFYRLRCKQKDKRDTCQWCTHPHGLNMFHGWNHVGESHFIFVKEEEKMTHIIYSKGHQLFKSAGCFWP